MKTQTVHHQQIKSLVTETRKKKRDASPTAGSPKPARDGHTGHGQKHETTRFFFPIYGEKGLKLQAADGHHKDAVGAAVGILSYGRQHHLEAGLRHTRGVELFSQSVERLHAFINKALASQFHLNQAIVPIAQMHHSIAFQLVAVAVVILFTKLRVFHSPS